jgi:NADPH:quinone reductase-like Zn-dependent oxidoreductase
MADLFSNMLKKIAEFNKYAGSEKEAPAPAPVPIPTKTMKGLYLKKTFKEPHEIKLSVEDLPYPRIKKGECLVQVYSAGVNASDVLGALGYIPETLIPRIPGRDFAGVVVEGSEKHLGKKVWGTGGSVGLDSHGTHAEFTTVPDSAIVEIPENMSVHQAGLQTLPYVTAYHGLIAEASMKSGDTVLVIGALGQVGRAAMNLCRWKNCKVSALVRGEANLRKAKNLGWEAFDQIPHDKTYDIILNTVGTYYWSAALQKLKNFGRLITIAAPEGYREASINLLDLYRRNIKLIGVNTATLSFRQSAKYLTTLKTGFESGALTPLWLDPDALYPIEKAELAYRQVFQNQGSKRIALILKPMH